MNTRDQAPKQYNYYIMLLFTSQGKMIKTILSANKMEKCLRSIQIRINHQYHLSKAKILKEASVFLFTNTKSEANFDLPL